ncbi:MAG: hypothetical protein Q8P50_05945 [Bacillota bacterium]|nr:hypothetical protein [Bacillota bacterium]
MLVANKVAELTGLIASLVTIGYLMWRGSKWTEKSLPKVRPIAGLDAIEDAVGRATEMGRPILVVPGTGDVTDSFAMQTIAGLAILRYTSSLCARMDTRMLVSIQKPNTFAIASEIVREEYSNAGRTEMFQEDTVQWLSQDQFAHATATVGLMHRENVASAVLTGFFQAESLMLGEAAGSLGALTIGGCGRLSQIPFFLICCDYCLIGEELMVAGAYLNKTPMLLGSIRAQDIMKTTLLGLTVAGVVMMTVSNNNSLIKLLKR